MGHLTAEQMQKARREFAKALDEAEQSYRRYLLDQIELALRRVRLHLNKLITIKTALKGGFIDTDAAHDWLSENASLDYTDPQQPPDDAAVSNDLE